MSGLIDSVGSRSGVISDTEMEHDFSGALDIVGMIAPFAMTSVPTGWLVCDGSAVSRTVTYSALFAAIGTTWGTGDGSSTFNVPDLEGAFSTNSAMNFAGYTDNSYGAFRAGDETRPFNAGVKYCIKY